MKKLLLLVLGVVLFTGVSNAQEYKPFKLGLGLGYAKPSGEGAGGGVLFAIEPAYRINDAIAVALRMEWAVMAKIAYDGSESSASANASYTVNGQYYLSNNKVRPYVGAGLGIFSLASVAVNSTSGGGDVGAKFGFYPRIGVDIGHFNINLDYNLIPATTAEDMDITSGEDIEIKNSYLGIRIGAYIFGGKN